MRLFIVFRFCFRFGFVFRIHFNGPLIVHSWFIRVLISTPLIAGVDGKEGRVYSGVYLWEVADSYSMVWYLTLWNSTSAPSATPSSSRIYCGKLFFTDSSVSL